jgi:hypothetical protein
VPVLVAFPVVVLVLILILSAFGINGTSTGMWWQLLHGSAEDPNLLLGGPRAITSDMWMVQEPWIASQAAQGFPSVNQTLPGGMDATFMNDLPAWDWSTVFRPHLWGYFVAPLAQGASWRWLCIGGLGVVSVYVFVVSWCPKRPLLAVLVALFTLYSPLVQWWYRPQTLFPLAWCMVTLSAIHWALHARPGSRTPRVLAGLAGYLAVPAALTIYVPFILPCAIVVLIVTVGASLEARRRAGWRVVLTRLTPLLTAGTTAAAVLVAWAFQHRQTIEAVMGTVYPGDRRSTTGACVVTADSCMAYFSAAWNTSLLNGTTGSTGSNPAEAATIIQIGVFLLPVLALMIIASARRRRIDWMAVSAVFATAVFLAFVLIPGWDWLSRALALDRGVPQRMRLGMLIAGVVSLAVVIARADDQMWSRRVRLAAVVATGGLALLIQAAVWWTFREAADPVLSSGIVGKLAVVLIIAGIALIPSRRPWAGMTLLLIATLVIAGRVNPVYRGTTDLAASPLGQAVAHVDQNDPGTWAGVTTQDSLQQAALIPGVLLSSGVSAMNGVQTYPPEEMWRQIDPTGQYEEAWNRLAGISWEPGAGEPRVSNPARDQIRVTFDSCSSFAQQNTRHVLALEALNQSCLLLDETVQDGNVTGYLYTVVADETGK